MSTPAFVLQQRRWVLGLAAALLAATSLVAVLVLTSDEKPPPEIQGSLLLEPRSLPRMNLVTHREQSLTDESLEGRWHLITYGFTHCPDICPTTLMELAAFARALEAEPNYGDLDVWFYTVDPGRDSADHLADYVPWFHPSFTGLLPANVQAARRFEQSLGIVAFVEPSDDPLEYQVAHGLQVFLLNDRGQLEAALHPTRQRNGSQHFDVDRLLADYLAIRAWRDGV
ncbi:MAG: SCO family protein [Saccharospirillum sp.]